MDDSVKKLTGEAIVAKLASLSEERAEIRAQQAALSRRDREIDREVADCRAAARVFGLDIAIPEEDESSPAYNWSTFNSRLLHLVVPAIGKAEARGTAVGHGSASVTGSPPPLPLRAPEMPRIRDIVLDRLSNAGLVGCRATEIRQYIERTYGKVIHEKTVGMTLYRLSQESPPLAHRDGRIWFSGPPPGGTENPGVQPPGPSMTNE